MVFGSRSRLEKKIAEAKKKKRFFEAKARLKDVEINKKIAKQEELDQLKFELKRLKTPPKTKAEAVQRQVRIAKAKRLAKGLGGSILKGAGITIKGLFLLGGGELPSKISVSKIGKVYIVRKVVGNKITATRKFKSKVMADKFAKTQRRKR